MSPPGMPRLSSRLDGGHGDAGLGPGGDLGGGPAFFAGDGVPCPSMPPLSTPSRTSRPRLHTTGGLGWHGGPSGLPTIESFAEPSPDVSHRGPLTSGDRMLSSDSNDLPSSMAEAVLASITSRGGTGGPDGGGNDGPPPCPSPSPFLGGPGMFSLSLDFLGGPGGPSCPPPPGLVPSSGSSEELAPRALRLGSSESTFSLPSPPSNGNGGVAGSRSWGTGTTGCVDPADGLAHDLGDLLRVYPGPPLRGRAATEPATSSTGADGLLGFGPAGGGGYPDEYTQF